MSHPPPPDHWPDPSAPPPAAPPPAPPPAQPVQPNFAADDRWLVAPPAPPVVPYGTAGAAPPGYAYPPGFGPVPGYGYPPPPRTNGMAIAAMVVSIVGAVSLMCTFCLMPLAVVALGGGITGTILGFVARRQIRERGDAGDGMALAGVIVGLITSIIGLLAIVAFVLWLGFAVSGDFA